MLSEDRFTAFSVFDQCKVFCEGFISLETLSRFLTRNVHDLIDFFMSSCHTFCCFLCSGSGRQIEMDLLATSRDALWLIA